MLVPMAVSQLRGAVVQHSAFDARRTAAACLCLSAVSQSSARCQEEATHTRRMRAAIVSLWASKSIVRCEEDATQTRPMRGPNNN